MHLSEREAAQQYGEVIGALITLQRRVRMWIEERKKVQDHNKVLARTLWEFGSFSKPDREAIRLRAQQRTTHGWRAPLNKQYAELGSSFTDPLSRTQNVHINLGRKPDGHAAKVDYDVLSQQVTPLTLGEAKEGVVPKFGIKRFVVQHEDPKGHLVITVHSMTGDDPDVFVSCGDEKPTVVEHHWASAGRGSDRIEVRPDDPRFEVGPYSIAVYGGGGGGTELAFAVKAFSFRPFGGSSAKMYDKFSNIERVQANRRFRLEKKQADVRRSRVMTGTPAAVLLITCAHDSARDPSAEPHGALPSLLRCEPQP